MLVLFFFFSFLHSYVAAYFFALLSLIVPNAPSLSSLPFFISFAYDIAASFCPPPVVRTFSAFKSMSFYQCSSRREGEKDFGLSCVFFFFYKLNVIIFDFFFFCLQFSSGENDRRDTREEDTKEIRDTVFTNRGTIIIIPVKRY